MAPHCHQHLWCTTRHWDADHLVVTDPHSRRALPQQGCPHFRHYPGAWASPRHTLLSNSYRLGVPRLESYQTDTQNSGKSTVRALRAPLEGLHTMATPTDMQARLRGSFCASPHGIGRVTFQCVHPSTTREAPRGLTVVREVLSHGRHSSHWPHIKLPSSLPPRLEVRLAQSSVP